jgi:hypothetical protein
MAPATVAEGKLVLDLIREEGGLFLSANIVRRGRVVQEIPKPPL